MNFEEISSFDPNVVMFQDAIDEVDADTVNAPLHTLTNRTRYLYDEVAKRGMKYAGAVIMYGNGQSVDLPSGYTASLLFPTTYYDDLTLVSRSSGTRLVVPVGVTRVRLSAQLLWENDPDGYRRLTIYRRSAADALYPDYQFGTIVSVQDGLNASAISDKHDQMLVTPVIPVSNGDYFTMFAEHNAGNNRSILTGSWVSMEVIR